MNTMTYTGIHARIEIHAEDEVFFGKIAGISDVIAFNGDSVVELKKAFHEQSMIPRDLQENRAKSLRGLFRKDDVSCRPEVHRRAALAAELSGKSLNQWAEEVLEEAADHFAEARLSA